MRHLLLAAAIVILPVAANAGCVTGAIVGGVVGHVAGGHGVLGAAGGCAIGHEHAKNEKAKAAQQANQPQQNPPQQ